MISPRTSLGGWQAASVLMVGMLIRCYAEPLGGAIDTSAAGLISLRKTQGEAERCPSSDARVGSTPPSGQPSEAWLGPTKFKQSDLPGSSRSAQLRLDPKYQFFTSILHFNSS